MVNPNPYAYIPECPPMPTRNEGTAMQDEKKLEEKYLNPTEHPAGMRFLAYRFDEHGQRKLTTCIINLWAPSGEYVCVNGEWEIAPVGYVELLPAPVEK